MLHIEVSYMRLSDLDPFETASTKLMNVRFRVFLQPISSRRIYVFDVGISLISHRPTYLPIQ